MRREAVRLEVEDHFTREILQAAAAAQALEKSLDSLSGSAVRSSRSVTQAERDVTKVGAASRRTSADINQLSGRLSILARVFATLGPAIAPVGAVGIAGIAGLASQLGFATVGALSLMVATQGVGDALKAVEKARLEPTVANLEAAEQAMSKLAPEAQAFVMRFQELRPVLAELRNSAAAGWFPGLTDALDALESAAPRLESLLLAVSTAGGEAVGSGAQSLASDRWAPFLEFIEDEAPDAIAALSKAVGSLTHGFAELWMAFDPLNDNVRDWLVDVSRSFDTWATGLDETEGFAEFLAYVDEMGPKVADAAGAIANAVLQIVQAAAPLGGPVLEGITAVANAIALIADSPIGAPLMAAVTAMSALSLTSRGASAALDALGLSAGGARNRLAALNSLKFAGLIAGLYVVNDAIDKLFRNDIEDSSLQRQLDALANGNWSEQLKSVKDDLVTLSGGFGGRLIGDYVDEVSRLGGILGDTHWEQAERNVQKVDDALAAMVESGQAERAAQIYDEFRAAIEETHPSRIGELSKVFDQYNLALQNTGPAAEKAAAATDRFSTAQARAKLAMQAAREAAVQSAGAFLDFSDAIAGEDFSLDRWLGAFEKQVRALANWQQNLQKLRQGGLNAFALDELIKQGPAAARAVDALANGGEKALERLNRASRKAGRELQQVGRDAAGAKKDVDVLGNAKPTPKAKLDKSDFDSTMSNLRGALNQTGNTVIKPRVGLTGVSAVEAQLDYLTRSRLMYINVISRRSPGDASLGGGRDTRGGSTGGLADGGFTGRGGKYEPAGVVHRGEVVIPQHLVRRDRALLLSRYGHLAGMDQLYSGGLAGYANGGRVGALDFAGLPALNLTTMQLGRLNKALAASEKALDREKNQREKVISKIGDVRSSVRDSMMSDLFGPTNPWSTGGSVADALGIVRGDIATGRDLKAQIAQLRKKGLGGDALASLLTSGDAATIASFASASRSELAQFEVAFGQRASLASSVAGAAGSAAFGAELKQQTRETRLVGAYVRRVEAAIKTEHREDRQSNRRGAGNASRNRRRG